MSNQEFFFIVLFKIKYMLHISDLRNNKKQIISSLKIKNFDAENLVNSAIAKDDERKAIQ